MTQHTQHNTRSRNWCFTLNNYEDEDIKFFQEIPKAKFTFQEETGKNGTPHLQGLLIFKDAKTFERVKKLHPKCHWEVCRNIKASQLYCSKEESKTGKTYSNMEAPRDPPKLQRQTNMTKEEIYKYLREKLMKQDEEDAQRLDELIKWGETAEVYDMYSSQDDQDDIIPDIDSPTFEDGIMSEEDC